MKIPFKPNTNLRTLIIIYIYINIYKNASVMDDRIFFLLNVIDIILFLH